MKICIKTYGCQMNERDSEAVGALLARHDHALVDDESCADVVIVNTCSVRGKAEDKALGKLGLLVAGRKNFPGRLVGAMGCMVERMKTEVLDRVPGLDFAVGTHGFSRVPVILERVVDGDGPVLDVKGDGDCFEELAGHESGGISAFVNILFGCDRRCTYCVVPEVRGSEWSRPADKVIDEVRGLAENGVREVTLLGQSVMSYGRRNDVWQEGRKSKRGFKEPLSRLLEAVGEVDGIVRVRFTSGHPSGCTEELARAMEEVPEVCEHLHLPVQSGADRILKMMRRGYKADDYRLAVNLLRSRLPGMAITTDVIVGFPSETEEEFEVTRKFMDEIGFDNAFIFKYSPRPRTEAEKLEDNVPADEKMRRNKVLLADQDRRGLAINEKFKGETLEVLVAGESPRNPEKWSGRARTNKIVIFDPPDGIEVGQLVHVLIDRAMAQTLYGKIVR